MFSANSSQVSEDRLYVEDVFSTWLYTSTGSNQTITNGINLAGKGGMVLFKGRSGSGGSYGWGVFDTNRGIYNGLRTNTTDANLSDTTSLTSFNSNGFGIGIDNNVYVANAFSGGGSASWTFREAPKFFDVVTYTGDGASSKTISHNLGSAPGFVIVKRTDSTSDWFCWHRELETPIGVNYNIFLNTTGARNANGAVHGIGNPVPTSTQFTVRALGNTNGATYVAYLFAHDTTSDGIIQCGSFTTDGSGNATVNLGWEPQWAMVKRTDSTSEWFMNDNMRGMPVTGSGASLYANRAFAEDTSFSVVKPTSTGFTPSSLSASSTYIYIAIRRGPMRTPTSGTSVFQPIARAGTGVSNLVVQTTVRPDMVMINQRNNTAGHVVNDRLRGGGGTYLYTNTTDAEGSTTLYTAQSFGNASYTQGTNDSFFCNQSYNYIDYAFTRAPSFFDVVCWTNTGATQNVSHNLGVVPELIITKRRAASENWQIYSAPTGASAYLNFTNLAVVTGNTNRWNATSPTSTAFTTGAAFNTTENYVAYLFASCPGVSKVGSYTGNGSSQTINCGFAAGARFVMIKRTDNAGSWFVWDTARGITSGNDPYLRMDSAGAEAGASYNSIDPDSSGFVVVQSDAAQININGATYIYLAVA